MNIQGIQFTPHPAKAGWYKSNVSGTTEEATETAIKLNQSHDDKLLAIVGMLPEDNYSRNLYLYPKNDPVEIAKIFEVGSHADYIDDPEENAQEQVRKVNEIAPLIPIYADPAGYIAVFTDTIDEEKAQAIEPCLEDVEPMMDEEEGEILAYLLEKQQIHLWWD